MSEKCDKKPRFWIANMSITLPVFQRKATKLKTGVIGSATTQGNIKAGGATRFMSAEWPLREQIQVVFPDEPDMATGIHVPDVWYVFLLQIGVSFTSEFRLSRMTLAKPF